MRMMSVDRSSRVSTVMRVLGVVLPVEGAGLVASPTIAQEARGVGSVSTTLRLVGCPVPGPTPPGAAPSVLAATGASVGVLVCAIAVVVLCGFALTRSARGARVVRVAGAVAVVSVLAASFALATGETRAAEANLPGISLRAHGDATLGAGGGVKLPVLTLTNGSHRDLTVETVTVSDGLTWRSGLSGTTVKAGGSATAGWKTTDIPKALADRLCASDHKELTVTLRYSYATDTKDLPPGPAPAPAPMPESYIVLFLIGSHGTSITGQIEFDVMAGSKLGDAKVMAPTVTAEAGYMFAGWKYSEDGNTYGPEDLLDLTMPDHNVTFTAVYAPGVSVSVEFDYGGGKDAQNRTAMRLTGPKGSKYTVPTGLTRENHRFVGWDPKPTGVFEDELNVRKHVAQWERISYEVTWDANGGGFPGGGPHRETVAVGSPAKGPQAAPSWMNTVFMGWNTQKDGMGEEVTPGVSKPTGDVTYYAQWMSYWMSSKGVHDPDPSKQQPYKNQRQIDSDMDNIRRGNQATMNEYQTLMNGDQYHFYTKVGGGSSAVDYLELRLVHVGNHDNDGSNVTLQATHSMTEAHKMNETKTNSGGWRDSSLRRKMNHGGVLWSKLSEGMRSRIKTVQKRTRFGSGNTSMLMTHDGMWLLSHSELSGTGVKGMDGNQVRTATDGLSSGALTEGSQYAYWKHKGAGANSVNPSLDPKMAWTRLLDTPTGGGESWWQRSPYTGNTAFMTVDPDGYLNKHKDADQRLGVVPAFCL